jgi:hypothetical protein
MLLLLTLAGTSMIQQNKQQLEMSGNTRILTQEFANAEGLLANAKTTINNWEQHVDPVFAINHSSHQCKTDEDTFKQDIGSAGSITGSGLPASNDKVMILAASCKQTKDGSPTKCSSYNPTTAKRTCYPKIPSHPIDSADLSKGQDCTNNTIAEITALFNDPTDLCYQPYDPNCDDDRAGSNPAIIDTEKIEDNYNPNPRCRAVTPNTIPVASCPYEVYTIKATSTNANGTTREIISDHAVLCASN